MTNTRRANSNSRGGGGGGGAPLPLLLRLPLLAPIIYENNKNDNNEHTTDPLGEYMSQTILTRAKATKARAQAILDEDEQLNNEADELLILLDLESSSSSCC